MNISETQFELIIAIAAGVSAIGLIIAVVAFMRSGRNVPKETMAPEQLFQFLRGETERVRELMQNHDRDLRKEINDRLERVHQVMGEVQTLAAGVGDLKKIFSNVRMRGTFGEGQLHTLLEQFLSPEQYVKNAQIKENSQERVEFAIKLPGREGQEVLMPVDSKFPTDDYERLITALENGDTEGAADASKALENRVRLCAKEIKEKYIYPPRTIEFGILFLPTESLYAEVLRRQGLFENIQREFHVTLSGPTTFAALLNALQMGFRSLALEKRSSEVWQILRAVHTEFDKYNEVVDKLGKQLNTASNTVSVLVTRTRAMNRKLFDVEKLPDDTTHLLLGPEFKKAEMEDESP
ncbi:MAG: DNA recombination protein RmuC [Stellaceae bacterium]|jgi:DNA recombination protein RmuC